MPDSSVCRYSDSHEWFHIEGDILTIGVTQYAANELTDITYVELKPVGDAISPGDWVGEVESVKTSSDIFSPVGGKVVEEDIATKALVDSEPPAKFLGGS